MERIGIWHNKTCVIVYVDTAWHELIRFHRNSIVWHAESKLRWFRPTRFDMNHKHEYDIATPFAGLLMAIVACQRVLTWWIQLFNYKSFPFLFLFLWCNGHDNLWIISKCFVHSYAICGRRRLMEQLRRNSPEYISTLPQTLYRMSSDNPGFSWSKTVLWSVVMPGTSWII